MVGKYVPAIAYKIHMENKNQPEIKMPLAGIALGDALSDPITQLNFGSFMYEIGLNGVKAKQEVDKLYQDFKHSIENKNWDKASKVW